VNEAQLRARLPPGLVHAPLNTAAYRRSAVLVPLEADRGVWLTRRSVNLPNHAGQVSFPGGKIEIGDASVEAAALREAEEEIGLPQDQVEILGRMDDFVTATGFHIAPVVGLVPKDVGFIADPREVAAVFCLPFAVLLDAAAPQHRRMQWQGGEREFLVWPHEEHLIWGATAAMLENLARRLRGDL